MDMKRITFLASIIALCLAGCHVVGSGKEISPKSVEPKIVPGVTTVSGMIISQDDKPIAGTPVHFAQVYREDGSAAFLYDASNSPSVISGENGDFNITELTAGEYVIVVGDPMSTYSIVSDEDGTPRVFVVQGSEPLVLQEVTVKYP